MTDHLEEALAGVRDRITMERLAERVDAVRRMKEENAMMRQVMNHLAFMLQKHPVSIIEDQNNPGFTTAGHPVETAGQELNDAFSLLRLKAIEVL